MTREALALGLTGMLAAAMAAAAPMRGGTVGVPPPESEITRIADSYAAAMNRGDAAAMAAVYADDGIEMPPGRPAVRGRSAIEAYHRQELAGPAKLTGFSLTALDTRVTGDVAYTTGTSHITVTPPDGAPPIQSAGKYLVVLRKQAGAWKAVYAIYNADGPCK